MNSAHRPVPVVTTNDYGASSGSRPPHPNGADTRFRGWQSGEPGRGRDVGSSEAVRPTSHMLDCTPAAGAACVMNVVSVFQARDRLRRIHRIAQRRVERIQRELLRPSAPRKKVFSRPQNYAHLITLHPMTVTMIRERPRFGVACSTFTNRGIGMRSIASAARKGGSSNSKRRKRPAAARLRKTAAPRRMMNWRLTFRPSSTYLARCV